MDLFDLSKIVGIAKFLTSEYAFRKNFRLRFGLECESGFKTLHNSNIKDELQINLEFKRINTGNNEILKKFVKFIIIEILTNSQFAKLKLTHKNDKKFGSGVFGRFSVDDKYKSDKNLYNSINNKFIDSHYTNDIKKLTSFIWKNITYFVDGIIMTEEEFHKYRDNLI